MIDEASMVAKYENYAKRHRRTDGRTNGRTNGRTDTSAYWDAIDSSNKVSERKYQEGETMVLTTLSFTDTLSLIPRWYNRAKG